MQSVMQTMYTSILCYVECEVCYSARRPAGLQVNLDSSCGNVALDIATSVIQIDLEPVELPCLLPGASSRLSLGCTIPASAGAQLWSIEPSAQRWSSARDSKA